MGYNFIVPWSETMKQYNDIHNIDIKSTKRIYKVPVLETLSFVYTKDKLQHWSDIIWFVISIIGNAVILAGFINFFHAFVLSGFYNYKITIYTNFFNEFYPELIIITLGLICYILSLLKKYKPFETEVLKLWKKEKKKKIIN